MAMDTTGAAEAEGQLSLSLTETLQEYMRQVPDDQKQQWQSELARFVRWVGGDRSVSSLAPPEIGDYSDLVSAHGTAPDANERLSVVKGFLAYLKKGGYIDISLAQHLRLRKGRGAAARARSSTEPEAVRLTREGHAELVQRLAKARTERKQLAEEIRRAAADKDVRENAPLEAAREAQGQVASTIAELEMTLRSATLIEKHENPSARVRLGSTVVLRDVASQRTLTCQIVAPNEANPLNSKISSVSPVGSAVLGQAPGDEVRVQTPRGQHVYLVVKTS